MRARKETRILSPEEIPLQISVLRGRFQRMIDRITMILRLQVKNNVKYARLHGKKYQKILSMKSQTGYKFKLQVSKLKSSSKFHFSNNF